MFSACCCVQAARRLLKLAVPPFLLSRVTKLNASGVGAARSRESISRQACAHVHKMWCVVSVWCPL